VDNTTLANANSMLFSRGSDNIDYEGLRPLQLISEDTRSCSKKARDIEREDLFQQAV